MEKRTLLPFSLISLFFVALLPVIIGCRSDQRGKSSEAGKLSGKVIYKDNPVTGGSMAFHPKSGGNKVSISINADGTFLATGLPLGEMSVSIETKSIKEILEQLAQRKVKGEDITPKIDKGSGMGKYVAIPEKYADPQKSGLAVTIAAGPQTKDFVLGD